MNIALWIVQILLALVFAMAGIMKVTRPFEKLAENIGVLEILGAIALILPAVTGILPWLTPVAAIGLVLTMIGAMITHGRRGEFPNMGLNLVLLLLAVFIVFGRFVAVPL